MGALRNPTIPNLQIILKKKSSRFMRIFQKNLTWSLGLETVALKKPTKTACHDQPRIDRGQCCEAGGCKDPWPLGASLDFGWPPPLFFWRGGGSTKMPGMKWGGGIQKTKRWFPLWLGFVYGKSPFFAPPFGMCFFVTGIPKHLLHANPRWFLHQTFGWFFLNDSGTWGYWQWAKTNHGEAPLDEM